MYYYLKQLSSLFVTALLVLVSFAPMQVTAAVPSSHDNEVAFRSHVRGYGEPYGYYNYNRGYYYNYYPSYGYRNYYNRPYYNSYYYDDYYNPYFYGGWNNGLFLRFNVR